MCNRILHLSIHYPSPEGRQGLRWAAKALYQILLLIGGFGSMSAPVFGLQTDKPNIVIILADDLGFGDVGGYYGGKNSTPYLSTLAQEGMLFTDFHSNGPMCSPTRASLLTGRYPQRLGVERAQSKVLDLPENADERTLAHYLKDAGYQTGIFGKWHLGLPPNGNPTRFGFDRFVGFHGGDLDYFSKVSRIGELDWWHNNRKTKEPGYATDVVTRHALDFIEDNTGGPFFLFVSHPAIHFPWQGPDDAERGVREEGQQYLANEPGPMSKLGPKDAQEIAATVQSMIMELDNSVGRIIAKLRERGLEKNTLVVFTSDNGGYLNYASGAWPAVGSNGPLKGQKTDVWEGGHRVPAIAWWPGTIPALSVCDQTIMTMDILPTVLDLVNLDQHRQTPDGVSLTAVLKGNASLPPRTLFWRIGNQKAVRHGQWKLVIQNNETGLYDLTHDIGEQYNVASDHPEIEARLKARLAVWEIDVRSE